MPKGNATSSNRQDIVTLREYVDKLFTLNQQAIDKAEHSMNNRLEGMNEFRDSLKDQAVKFISRDEINLMFKQLEDRTRDKTALIFSVLAAILSAISILHSFFP